MLTWIIVIFVIIALINNYNKKNTNTLMDEKEPEDVKKLTDEDVFKAQARFVSEIEQSYLPDSIGGKAIYIYKNLMNQWFTKLSSENRYNEEMIQKLRRDFVDYMYAVREGSTASFLSFELEDEKKKKEYDEEATILGGKVYSIENAFAAMIGEDAVTELSRIRNLGFGVIDHEGNLIPKSKDK